MGKLIGNCHDCDKPSNYIVYGLLQTTVMKISVQRAVKFKVAKESYGFIKDRFNIFKLQYKKKWPKNEALGTALRTTVVDHILFSIVTACERLVIIHIYKVTLASVTEDAPWVELRTTVRVRS